MNTELNFPRRLLAGLTALALLLMLALPVWAEGEETEKLPISHQQCGRPFAAGHRLPSRLLE